MGKWQKSIHTLFYIYIYILSYFVHNITCIPQHSCIIVQIYVSTLQRHINIEQWNHRGRSTWVLGGFPESTVPHGSVAPFHQLCFNPNFVGHPLGVAPLPRMPVTTRIRGDPNLNLHLPLASCEGRNGHPLGIHQKFPPANLPHQKFFSHLNSAQLCHQLDLHGQNSGV